jgi:hypothetical protein
MGQFDSPTEAALARLKSESLFSSSVDGKVEKVAGIGAYLLEVAGFTGASRGFGFLSALKNLAASKDEANLTYFGESLVDDIRRLYRLHEELRHDFDECLRSSEFDAAVANATLHITRTNVETRLKRLSHLIANGVKASDLEPESLDDMMRAAVELTERDILLLGRLYKSQESIMRYIAARPHSHQWYEDVGAAWEQEFSRSEGDHLNLRGSFMRLRAFGLIAETGANLSGDLVKQPFGLLLEGKEFYEQLQEIAAK